MLYKVFITILFFFSCLVTKAFNSDSLSLKLKGEILIETDEPSICDIYLYRGNDLIDSIKSSAAGIFEIDVKLGYNYTIEISKPGFYSKRFCINAEVDDINTNFPNFEFICEMFLRNNEIEYTILDFPVTIIQVNKKKGEFEYSKSYTKHINKKRKSLNQEMSQNFEF